MTQLSFIIETPQLIKIRELPPQERPINRLNHKGATALSNAELIATIINTPSALSVAQLILKELGSLREIARASPEQLANFPELGKTNAARLKAAFELGRRLIFEDPNEQPITITSPADAANLLIPDMDLLEQEELWIILLNTRNHVIDITKLYRGSTNTSLIRVAEVFRDAIKRNCAAIIIAHNHPSGDPTPSPEDVFITRQIHEAGKLLDIELLDHLIIGHQRFVSLKERGLGFSS